MEPPRQIVVIFFQIVGQLPYSREAETWRIFDSPATHLFSTIWNCLDLTVYSPIEAGPGSLIAISLVESRVFVIKCFILRGLRTSGHVGAARGTLNGGSLPEKRLNPFGVSEYIYAQTRRRRSGLTVRPLRFSHSLAESMLDVGSEGGITA